MYHGCCMLRAMRWQALIQDSNAFPSLACTVWNIRHASMQKKTLSHCFTTRTNRAGNSLRANRTRSSCLSPLSPHTLKSGKRGTSCLQAWFRESRAFPTAFSTGKLKLHENAISVRRVTREGAGREFETGNRTGDTRKNLM